MFPSRSRQNQQEEIEEEEEKKGEKEGTATGGWWLGDWDASHPPSRSALEWKENKAEVDAAAAAATPIWKQ